jgi:SAM-dependent methyltransferase
MRVSKVVIVGKHVATAATLSRRRQMKTQEIKQALKTRYGKCAEAGEATMTCCGAGESDANSSHAAEHGLYSTAELSSVPAISRDLSRGCGNPTGFAKLKPGEVVVDFGCGAGIDVILAAREITPGGKVIGVDFAPQMIERAKQAVSEGGLLDAVEFVVADLEQVTVPDGCADVVTSNCVINLCPDKGAVYREIFRILKPGGRVAISDIVYEEKIDPRVRAHLEKTWSGCVGGSIDEESYFKVVDNAGFIDIEVVARHLLRQTELEEMACCPGPEFAPKPDEADLQAVQGKVASIKFTAAKPAIKS